MDSQTPDGRAWRVVLWLARLVVLGLSVYALAFSCPTCPGANALSNWSQGFAFEGTAFGLLVIAAAFSRSRALLLITDCLTVLAACFGVLLAAVMAATGLCWTCLSVWAAVWVLAADVLRRNSTGRARETVVMAFTAVLMLCGVGWVGLDAQASAAMRRAVQVLNPPLATAVPVPEGIHLGAPAPRLPGLPATGRLLFWARPCQGCWASTVSRVLKSSGATLVSLDRSPFVRKLAGGNRWIVANQATFDTLRIPPQIPIIVSLDSGRLIGWSAADRYGGRE